MIRPTYAIHADANGEFLRLLLGGGEQSGNIWSLSLETRRKSPVTDLRGRRGRLGEQSLSTDGEWLYFTWREDVGDIWVMDVASE